MSDDMRRVAESLSLDQPMSLHERRALCESLHAALLAAVAAERERCARVVECHTVRESPGGIVSRIDLADAIRAGNTDQEA